MDLVVGGGATCVCDRAPGAGRAGGARRATPAAPAAPNWDPRPWALFIVTAILVVVVVLKFRAHRRTTREDESRYTDLLRTLHGAEHLGALVALVRDGSPVGKVAAANALCILAHSDDNRKSLIASAGGIGALVALVRDGSPAGQAAAANALRDLAYTG